MSEIPLCDFLIFPSNTSDSVDSKQGWVIFKLKDNVE